MRRVTARGKGWVHRHQEMLGYRQTDSFNLGHNPTLTDRQTVFSWDMSPHTPPLYLKPAPPLHLPRHNDLLRLPGTLPMSVEMYRTRHYASPAETVQATRRASRAVWGVLVFGCVPPRARSEVVVFRVFGRCSVHMENGIQSLCTHRRIGIYISCVPLLL